jgi:hypothetical protein
MMELESGIMVGETYFLEPKGKEKKNETKEDGKAVVIGVNKAWSQSKGKAKGICFYCKEDGHWTRNCPKSLALKYLGKSFLLALRYTCSKNPPEFLVCGFATSTSLQLDCQGSMKL